MPGFLVANYFSKPHLSVRIWVCRLSLILFALMLVTESGNALFFDDIYGHDQRLEAALNSRRPRSVL